MTGNTACGPSDAAIWRILFSDLTPYSRTRVQGLFASTESPPFFPFVIEAIEADAEGGRRTPKSSVLMDSIVLGAISNPSTLSLGEAVRLARAAKKLDDRLDDKMLTRLTGPPREWPLEVPEAETARVLEVIDEISDCRRLVMPLMKFLKLPQQHFRSKVAKLIARASKNPGWVETLLKDPDPRVRSNLIDEIALQSGLTIDALLQRATKDTNHRVATTALLGLCRRGDESSCHEIRRLASEGDEGHRRAAKWALRQLESKNAVQSVSAAIDSAPNEVAPKDSAESGNNGNDTVDAALAVPVNTSLST